MPLRKLAKEIAAKYKVNPFPINQVMDEMAEAGYDPDAIDWNTVVGDTLDFGITVKNLWDKLSQYYALSRPIEKAPLPDIEEIEERAKEFKRSELEEILETLIVNEADNIRRILEDEIYQSLKKLIEDVPETASPQGVALMRATIQRMERLADEREKEIKDRIQKLIDDLKESYNITLKAEIGKIREQAKETLKKVKPTPGIEKARERLKTPPTPEEIAPEGFTREKVISITRTERDPFTGEETEVVEFIDIPPELSIFRSPDGRLFRIRDKRITETNTAAILKLIRPPPPKPPAVRRIGPPTGIVLGVPKFITPPSFISIEEVLTKADKIKARDPEFVKRLQSEGRTLQQIVEEYERTKGPV